MYDNTACCGVNDHAAVCWGHGFCWGWHGTDLALVNAGHLGPGSGPLGTGLLLFIVSPLCGLFSHQTPCVCDLNQSALFARKCYIAILPMLYNKITLSIWVCGCGCVCVGVGFLLPSSDRPSPTMCEGRVCVCIRMSLCNVEAFEDILCFMYLMLSLLFAFIGVHAECTWSEYCGE